VAGGADDIRAEVLASPHCVWEPVGTLREYLDVNLHPPDLSYLDPDVLARRDGTRFEEDCVIGRDAVIGTGARLRRAVVWDGERVPDGFEGSDGVYAGGEFHSQLAGTEATGDATP
jgi:hypothetical protein